MFGARERRADLVGSWIAPSTSATACLPSSSRCSSSGAPQGLQAHKKLRQVAALAQLPVPALDRHLLLQPSSNDVRLAAPGHHRAYTPTGMVPPVSSDDFMPQLERHTAPETAALSPAYHRTVHMPATYDRGRTTTSNVRVFRGGTSLSQGRL
jgi:hypothetical protein